MTAKGAPITGVNNIGHYSRLTLFNEADSRATHPPEPTQLQTNGAMKNQKMILDLRKPKNKLLQMGGDRLIEKQLRLVRHR